MRKHLLSLCFFFTSLSVASSLNLPEFDKARDLYYRGSSGDSAAYQQADKLFGDLYAQSGLDPRVQVYYGSLRLLEASRIWALWKKYALSKNGIQLMDTAVAAAPHDLEIRFVRAITTSHLPGFFHRQQQSRDDFAYMAARVEPALVRRKLDPRLAAASLFQYGISLQQQGNQVAAEAEWRRAIRLAPDARAAQEARKALKMAESK